MDSQSCICVDYLIFNTVFRGRRYIFIKPAYYFGNSILLYYCKLV